MFAPSHQTFAAPRADRCSLAIADLVEIAVGLARSAPLWDRQLPRHPTARTAVEMLATAGYDVWLVRWPPGSRVTPHDHGDSAGVLTVVAGILEESRWHRHLRHRRVLEPMAVAALEHGLVHDVAVVSKEPALSVHVYSPPLESMGFYDDDATTLLDVEPVDPAVTTIDPRALHPSSSHRVLSPWP
jgi:hypothetical protein